ncbi:MAG: hypothetical protein ACRDG3_05110 [Tepidiformaceae bacterium]
MDSDFAILAAIASHDGCAVDLAGGLEALGISLPRSTLYRRVQSLVAGGLLRAGMERREARRPRRSVVLTAVGRDWLANAVSTLLRTEHLDSPDFALALSCAGSVDRETLAGVLKPRVAAAASRLTLEERSLLAAGEGPGDWSQICCERRIAYLQADISWLESVLRLSPAPPTGQTSEAS